jgi:hypothetical protein
VTRFEVARGDGSGARAGRDAGVRFVRIVEHDGYEPGARMLVVRLHDAKHAPASVELQGEAGRLAETPAGRGWAYDSLKHVLIVRFPATGERQELRIH